MKFLFGTAVKVTAGFYLGCVGHVVDVRSHDPYQFLIKQLYCEQNKLAFNVWFYEKELAPRQEGEKK